MLVGQTTHSLSMQKDTIIFDCMWKKIGYPKLDKFKKKLYTYADSELEVMGLLNCVLREQILYSCACSCGQV